MVFKEIISSAIISVILVTAVFYGFKNKGPWNSFWLLFFMVFLAVWSSALWLKTTGPEIFGVYWVNKIYTGISITLILAILSPLFHLNEPKIPIELPYLERQRLAKETDNEKRKKKIVQLLFMLALMGIFSIAIILGYILKIFL